MNNERHLVVISGPSGCGKDTVVKHLCKEHPDIEVSVSATSRQPRAGEKEGVNYYFLTREGFEQKIAAGEILEYTEYCGNYYGTLKQEVDKRIQQNKTVVLVIEVEGAANLRRMYPECTTIFIRPPSYEELRERLMGRGTEDEVSIRRRLARAVEEMEYAAEYHYVVINSVIAECAEEIYNIIQQRLK